MSLSDFGIIRRVTVVASLRNDVYIKPHTGMWQFVCETLLSGQHVDPSASYYVGDAAGRPKRGIRKRDFSACDIQFARYLDLMCHTPDAFFLGADDNYTSIGFNSKDYWK
jgi:bifunctional polynucleotide phosphatase/kinase